MSVTHMVNRNLSSGNDYQKITTKHDVVVTSKRPLDVPLVSFVEGFRNKPSFGLRAWNHLILTLDGRDKVTKLLQYLCRFLAWWLQQSKHPRSTKSAFFIVERFVALKNSLATSRKAFRLGRSMIEIQKIQSLGVLQWIECYLYNRSSSSGVSGDAKALSNTRLKPLRSIITSMFCPVGMHASSMTGPDGFNAPLSNIVGNSIKSLGLLFFWAADNVSFLYQTGFLDDFQTDMSNRLSKRSMQIEKTTNIANRSYFVAAIAGLVTNWIAYWNYTQKQMMELQHNMVLSESNDEMCKEAKVAFQKAQEKQFTLFVALVKSVCDVLVFSNNSGLNLWKQHCGRPLHEGVHCLCGIVSASVVLYNNYPNVVNLE